MTAPAPPAALVASIGVSRETAGRLSRYAELLARWQATTNLVGPTTLPSLWERHIADSAELVRVAPSAHVWLDLGSGAGLPGLIVAILLADRGGFAHLVESNGKKCAFLRAAIAATGAPARVHQARAETVVAAFPPDDPLDAVSARGLAPLVELLALTAPLSGRGIPAYFHKGAGFAAERDAAAARFRFDLVEHESRFGPGVIAEIRNVRPR